MQSVLFVAAFVLVATGLGWSLVAWLDRRDALSGGERVVVAFAVGVPAFYFGVFAVGPFRLDAPAMWGLAAAAGLLALPGLARMPWRAGSAALGRGLEAARIDPWLAVFALGAAGIAAVTLLQGLAPPNDYDALMYHLVYPQYDVEAGRIGFPWERNKPVALTSALGGHLSRFSLAAMGAGAAQMLHGLFGVVGAFGAAFLARRLGYGHRVMVLSALMFLAIRVVIWQMATVETDVPLAGYAVMALVVYLAVRERGEPGTAALFGLLIGGAILFKYNGFAVAVALAPVMLWDLAARRLTLPVLVIGPLIASAVISPKLIQTFVQTGNPIFPAFNGLFNPHQPNFWADMNLLYGAGRDIADLALAPWRIFIVPMHHFDGMIFGAPFLLAFAPLILLTPRRLGGWLPVLGVVLVFFVIWFYQLTQQVRFLLPVMPMLAAAAAAGAHAVWDATGGRVRVRAALVAVFAVLAVNQAMFVGIYAALRLPVVVGLMDKATYLRTPNLTTSFYDSCQYVRDNLRPGERYYANIIFPSFYCPQTTMTYVHFRDEARWWLESPTPPAMDIDEFIRRAEEENLRFFVVPKGYEFRRNAVGRAENHPLDLKTFRFGSFLVPALERLTPLQKSTYTAVYDGPAVIAELRKIADSRRGSN